MNPELARMLSFITAQPRCRPQDVSPRMSSNYFKRKSKYQPDGVPCRVTKANRKLQVAT